MKTGLTIVLGVLVLGLLLALVLLFQNPGRKTLPEMSYSQVLALRGRLKSAEIRGTELVGRDDEGHRFSATIPADPALPTRLADAGTEVVLGPARDETNWVAVVLGWLPSLVFLVVLGVPLFRIARALESRSL